MCGSTSVIAQLHILICLLENRIRNRNMQQWCIHLLVDVNSGTKKKNHKDNVTKVGCKEGNIGQQYLIRFNKSGLEPPLNKQYNGARQAYKIIWPLKLLNKKHGWDAGERWEEGGSLRNGTTAREQQMLRESNITKILVLSFWHHLFISLLSLLWDPSWWEEMEKVSRKDMDK